jgi:hypothetical protein
MNFLHYHVLALGITADLVTLAGALVLAAEAFSSLQSLVRGRLHEDFKKRYRKIQGLQDWQEAAAKRVVRSAWTGASLLALGCLLEVLTRIADRVG